MAASVPSPDPVPGTDPGPELVIARVLDAPRELVFRAWTEQAHRLRWFAPHGFTVVQGESDPRPGGAWRSCMRSPDGVDHWHGGVWREVVRPERLVFTFAWDEDGLLGQGRPGRETLVTVTFAERGGRTTMTFRQTGFGSGASRDDHGEGWAESFERLAALLPAV